MLFHFHSIKKKFFLADLLIFFSSRLSNCDQFPNKPRKSPTFACQNSPQTFWPDPRKLYSVCRSPPEVTCSGHSLRCRSRRKKTQHGALIWHQPLSDCPPWRWMRKMRTSKRASKDTHAGIIMDCATVASHVLLWKR